MPPVIQAKKKQFRAVGAYVFAGGFTVGVKAAGFDVLCHLEGRPAYGADIVRLNFPGLPIHEGADSWPVDKFATGPEIDFIYGNPPCAAWSGNNPNAHVADAWRTDPRVNCTREHFSLLERLRPKVWMWESVTAAATRGAELVEELTTAALTLGYSVTQVFHDAKDLGTPQTRKRWFLIAHRIEVKFPESALLPEISAVEALSKIRPIGPPAYDSGSNASFNEYLHLLRPGQRLRSLQEEHLMPEGGWEIKPNGHCRGRVGFGHVRLRDSGPATATVGYSMVHPTENRFLSVNEVQALAGFPQNYRFPGKDRGADQLDLIARGVCPPVGEWFADRVAEALIRNVAVTEPVATVVDLITPRSKSLTKRSTTIAMPKRINTLITSSQKEQYGVTVKASTKNSLRGRLGVPGSKPQDLDRRYDTTQLRETGHGKRIHRDYAAHFFRWGWASRFVQSGKTKILDVGCGQDLPLVKILTASLSTVPAEYVGVDLNRIAKKPGISWVTKIYDEFDFPGGGWETIVAERGIFDLISCFEVVEHMHREDGLRLLSGIVGCLADDGRALVSTPVYDGKKMAANHIKEYTIAELQELIEEAGLEVVERFGTFASWNVIKKVCTADERKLLEETGRFYGHDVLACFLAPKYPDASRNNAWVLKKA